MRILLLIPLGCLLLPGTGAAADFDHSEWNQMLVRYVDERHRVDYAAWKRDGLAPLDAYLESLAAAWPEALSAGARKAALINAYNALTVRWILDHYPLKSIWKTKKPFREKRHRLGGNAVSLDDIETRLRETGDPRIHAALVCAALSCPPLRREAYQGDRIDEQLAGNTREWLADSRLNAFDPERRTARISSIFKWYRKDFEVSGDRLGAFLARHGPPHAAFAADDGAKIDFLDYRWGLNDISTIGEDYGGAGFYWDYLRNR